MEDTEIQTAESGKLNRQTDKESRRHTSSKHEGGKDNWKQVKHIREGQTITKVGNTDKRNKTHEDRVIRGSRFFVLVFLLAAKVFLRDIDPEFIWNIVQI